MTEILATFTNTVDGIQSFVTTGAFGFHVSLKDIDSGEFVGSYICYESLEVATAKAKEIV